MSLNRYATSRDSNEPQIVKEFEGHRWLVLQLKEFDLLVCHRSCKQLLAVEVKTPQDEKQSTAASKRTRGGTLTQRQKALIESGWPLYIIKTPEEVRELIAAHGAICPGRAMPRPGELALGEG